MNKPGKTIFYVGLVVLSLAIVVLFVILTLFSGSDDPRGIRIVEISENKKLMAIGYDLSGGGGPGWCVFQVDVLDLTESYFWGYKSTTVFESESCEDGHQVNWVGQSSNTLEIICPKSDYDYRNAIQNNAYGVDITFKGCD